MAEKGKLIVISGPSGAGKSTVVNRAIQGRTDMCFSTSVTTRSPRPGEVDGKDYFFIDQEHFQQMVGLPKMKADLERYGIRFDTWFYESSLHESGYVAETV